jgi:hypothetical protein
LDRWGSILEGCCVLEACSKRELSNVDRRVRFCALETGESGVRPRPASASVRDLGDFRRVVSRNSPSWMGVDLGELSAAPGGRELFTVDRGSWLVSYG